MTYSHEVEHICVVKKGPKHGPAPIPEEGKWVKAKEIVDISGLTHGIGWCAPQQGACNLTINVKEGVIQMCIRDSRGNTYQPTSASVTQFEANSSLKISDSRMGIILGTVSYTHLFLHAATWLPSYHDRYQPCGRQLQNPEYKMPADRYR